ncbi:MAG: sugar phosphate isomerase/epimerase [Verrucomicrobiae bacterium]|nr:sugar phosphate isomerase/epimerase [Verrucomicrobiae bacterium]
MKESWLNYVKLGIVHFMAFPQCMKGEGPVYETLERIAHDEFFDAVEVAWIKDDAARTKARNLFESSHMTVIYCAHPRILSNKLDLNSLDAAERRKALDEVKRGIDEAKFLGCKDFAFLSGKRPDPSKLDEYKKVFIESCYEICEYAAPMMVHLETFDFDVDKCCLVGPSDLAREVALKVRRRCANFGLLLDLSHIPIQQESASLAIPTVGELLTAAHIGNAYLLDKSNPAYGDNHPRFGYPGGCNDVNELTEFLAQLFKSGYLAPGKRPVVSFEVKPTAGESSEVIIANSKRAWKEAWARL